MAAGATPGSCGCYHALHALSTPSLSDAGSALRSSHRAPSHAIARRAPRLSICLCCAQRGARLPSAWHGKPGVCLRRNRKICRRPSLGLIIMFIRRDRATNQRNERRVNAEDLYTSRSTDRSTAHAAHRCPGWASARETRELSIGVSFKCLFTGPNRPDLCDAFKLHKLPWRVSVLYGLRSHATVATHDKATTPPFVTVAVGISFSATDLGSHYDFTR